MKQGQMMHNMIFCIESTKVVNETKSIESTEIDYQRKVIGIMYLTKVDNQSEDLDST